MNERMKDMKTKLMIMAVGMLMVCLLPLAANAQPQEQWQSTSAMKTSGSNYTPQINAIGAESAQPMATTTTATYTPSKAPGGPNRSIEYNDDFGGDEGSPIGDAMLPLMLCAVVFGGAIAFRRRREA